MWIQKTPSNCHAEAIQLQTMQFSQLRTLIGRALNKLVFASFWPCIRKLVRFAHVLG